MFKKNENEISVVCFKCAKKVKIAKENVRTPYYCTSCL